MTASAVYGCSSAGDGIRYVVNVWGMDKEGEKINAVITCSTERVARHAAVAALVEFGAREHFCIAPVKGQSLPRPLTELKALLST